MKNTIHFILDFETIGQDVMKIPMIDVAYTRFDWARFTTDPYTFEEITKSSHTLKANVAEQMDSYGCEFIRRDLAWWESQGDAAKKKILPSTKDLPLQELCDTLLKYITDGPKIGHWWSRSNTFDPLLLQRFMGLTGNGEALQQALKYYLVRDTRTFIDAKLDFPYTNGFVPVSDEDAWKNAFVGHDSTHDIAADILRLQTIVREEHGLPFLKLNGEE